MPDHISIDNGGVTLALSRSGSGPDLLFVHGLGSAQVLWEPLIGGLADRFTCWNLDLRGHGTSAWAPGTYSMSNYACDVAAALGHIARPTIGIGHSLGGMSLVRAAAIGLAPLRAVCALDSPLLRRPGESSSMAAVFERQLAMVREFQADDRPIDDYEVVLAGAPNPVGGTNRETMVPHQLRGRAESLSQMDPECMAVIVDGTDDATFVEPRLDIPLRVVAADPAMGAAFRPEHHAELRALTPHIEITTIDGVGHQLMMMLGFDELVRLDLEDWLARVSS